MPKIIEYDAKQDKLNPSNLGYSAAEMAARREGAFYEQMAQGTREVGRLQDDYDKEVGQQITDFLRFKGLEDAASNVAMRVTGGGRAERTLIGTGTNPGITYSHMNEMANGPRYMSRLARSMVSRNSPLNPNTPVWNNDTQQYESANQRQRDTSAIDKYNQSIADQLHKADVAAGYFGGDPIADMAQITNQANLGQTDLDKLNANSDYTGPGATFQSSNPDTAYVNPFPDNPVFTQQLANQGTPYSPSATTIDTGQTSQETAPNTSNSNPWSVSTLFSDIADAQVDTLAAQAP